jgi:transcriptional regulator with XRE-family HTH domain
MYHVDLPEPVGRSGNEKGRRLVSRDADEAGIGERVRSARLRAGLSREALAFHAGVSWSAIAQVESGRRTNLRPGTLASLARALGVTIDYLVCSASLRPAMLEHRVLFYEDEDEFLTGAVAFLSGLPDRSEAAMVSLAKAKTRLLQRHLELPTDAVAFVHQNGRGGPVAALGAYREFVAEAIAAGATWVRILAEPSWSHGEGKAGQWARCEALLNLVFSHAPVSLLCLYDAKRIDPVMAEQIYATHPQAVEQEGIRPTPGYRDPATEVLHT